MTRRLIGTALLVGAVVVVVGLAQGWWQDDAQVFPQEPLVATSSLSSRALAFGDPVTARLDLLVDPRAVDPASLHVTPRFSPYRIVSTSRTIRRGGAVLLSYRYALECLLPACVPARAGERQFLPALVSFRPRSGGRSARAVDWPSYQISSRITDADRRDPAGRLRVDPALPPPSYRIAPATLRTLLTALSAALALAAAALGTLALRSRARRPAPAEHALSSLERALRRVRESISARSSERRKALGGLGRELRAVDRSDLAHDAHRLAWSEDAPSAEATGAFAAQVEESRSE